MILEILITGAFLLATLNLAVLSVLAYFFYLLRRRVRLLELRLATFEEMLNAKMIGEDDD